MSLIFMTTLKLLFEIKVTMHNQYSWQMEFRNSKLVNHSA